MNLEKKVAVVTSGTGGLGWDICKKLAGAKMRIVLVYHNSAEKAAKYVSELKGMGAEAVSVRADVTEETGIKAMMNTAISNFGSVDALVLSAAFNQWVPFANVEELTPDIWNKIISCNLSSPFFAMRIIGQEMKRRGCGRIVTVSSIAGLHPSGSSIAYAVSKAGLIHLTHCMAVALAPEVLVNGVAPGLMEGTRMTANLAPEYAEQSRRSTLLGKAAERYDVADAVRLFIETDSITGQNLAVDCGKVFH